MTTVALFVGDRVRDPSGRVGIIKQVIVRPLAFARAWVENDDDRWDTELRSLTRLPPIHSIAEAVTLLCRAENALTGFTASATHNAGKELLTKITAFLGGGARELLASPQLEGVRVDAAPDTEEDLFGSHQLARIDLPFVGTNLSPGAKVLVVEGKHAGKLGMVLSWRLCDDGRGFQVQMDPNLVIAKK